MDFESDNLDFSPNLQLSDKRTIKAAREILKFANACVKNIDTDMLDVLMTTLWVCIHARSAKKIANNTIPNLCKYESKDNRDLVETSSDALMKDTAHDIGITASEATLDESRDEDDHHTDPTVGRNTSNQATCIISDSSDCSKMCLKSTDIQGSTQDKSIDNKKSSQGQNSNCSHYNKRCGERILTCDKSTNTCTVGNETQVQIDVHVSEEDETLAMDCDSINKCCLDSLSPYTANASMTSDSSDNSFANSDLKPDTFFIYDSFGRKLGKKSPNGKPFKKKRKIELRNLEERTKEGNQSFGESNESDATIDEADMPEPVMMLTNIYNKSSGGDTCSSVVGVDSLGQCQLMNQAQTPATTSSSAAEDVFKDLLPDPNQEISSGKFANIQSANSEVISLLSQPLGKRKRGPYVQYNSEERARIGRWACEYGTATTIRLFVQEFGKPVHESTVRSIKKAYILQCQKSEEKVDSLEKNVGRPKLLGEFDKDVVEYIQKLRTSGAIVNRKIVIAGATGIIKNKASHLLKENGGHVILDDSWAESLLRRVGFRRKSISKMTCELPQDFEAVQDQFLCDVHNLVDSLQVPDQLVFNIHQTKINIIPCGNWVAEPAGSKHIELKKLEDKRKVTALLTCTMAGELLPMQVLYLGKTDQCHARVNFPSEWDVWHSENQCSNEETLGRFAEKILIPYVKDMRQELDLSKKHPAVVVLGSDGPKSESFLQTLSSADIHVKVIPWGCASKIEPLSISGNSQIKDEIKSQFINWYADKVAEEIEGANDIGFVPNELKLTWMKPIHADWMVNAWTKVKDEAQTMLDGWLQSGIKRVKNEIQ